MEYEDVVALKNRIRADAQSRGIRRQFAYGIGLTNRPGEYNLAIRVPSDESATWFKAEYGPQIGAPRENLDVLVVDRAREALPVEAVTVHGAPLAIGARVRHANGRRGTLGFFARRHGLRGFVSCNHVIARKDRAAFDDPVHGPTDMPIGKLQWFVKLNVESGFVVADAAFAAIDEAFWPRVPGSVGADGLLAPMPAVIDTQRPVFKLGIATRRTEGVVSAINLDSFRFDYLDFFSSFNDVIEIQSANTTDTFADAGDSGSLVMTTDDNRPVGLLFAERVGGPGNTGLHYLNPIADVLKVLEAEIIV